MLLSKLYSLEGSHNAMTTQREWVVIFHLIKGGVVI